jgi:hypothetical protein
MEFPRLLLMEEVKSRVMKVFLMANSPDDLCRSVENLLKTNFERLRDKKHLKGLPQMCVKNLSATQDLRLNSRMLAIPFLRFMDTCYFDMKTNLSLPLTRVSEYGGKPFRSISLEFGYMKQMDKEDQELVVPLNAWVYPTPHRDIW